MRKNYLFCPVITVRNRKDTHLFNNEFSLIFTLKSKATGALVVIVFLFSIVTIIPINLAHASSSQRILLEQQFEQFPGQTIQGFCNMKFTDDGHLEWRIKVEGLASGTEGHFDLNHWLGESDVYFTADDEGKADSNNQIVNTDGFAKSLFSKFVKCQVLTTGRTHFTSPVIALGIPGSSSDDTNKANNQVSSLEQSGDKIPSEFALVESKFTESENRDSNLIKPEKKFFLFATLDYVFGFFKNNNLDDDQNTNSFSSEANPPGLSRANNKINSDDFSPLGFIFGPPSPFENNEKNKGPTEKGSDNKASTEKGSDNKGPTEKGSDNKASTEKGSDNKKQENEESGNENHSEKNSVDKESSEKDYEAKDPPKRDSDDKGSEKSADSIKCSPGQKKKGLC